MDRLDHVVRELEQDTHLHRIKRLLFCACYGQWEDQVQRLDGLHLRNLIHECLVCLPSPDALQLQLNGIVKTLNKPVEYAQVAHRIVQALEPLYRYGYELAAPTAPPYGSVPGGGYPPADPAAQFTGQFAGQFAPQVPPQATGQWRSAPPAAILRNLAEPIAPHPVLEQVLAQTAHNLYYHPDALRLKKLLICVCNNYWENDPTRLNHIDWQPLLHQLLQLIPTPENLDYVLQSIVRSLSKPLEYIRVVNILHQLLAPLYSTYQAHFHPTPPHYPDPNATQFFNPPPDATQFFMAGTTPPPPYPVAPAVPPSSAPSYPAAPSYPPPPASPPSPPRSASPYPPTHVGHGPGGSYPLGYPGSYAGSYPEGYPSYPASSGSPTHSGPVQPSYPAGSYPGAYAAPLTPAGGTPPGVGQSGLASFGVEQPSPQPRPWPAEAPSQSAPWPQPSIVPVQVSTTDDEDDTGILQPHPTATPVPTPTTAKASLPQLPQREAGSEDVPVLPTEVIWPMAIATPVSVATTPTPAPPKASDHLPDNHSDNHPGSHPDNHLEPPLDPQSAPSPDAIPLGPTGEVHGAFDLRLEVMKYANPLLAKLILFSVLVHTFHFSEQDWFELRQHSLEELLAQLPTRYPQRPELEARLQVAAEELTLGDRALQTVGALVRILPRLYAQVAIAGAAITGTAIAGGDTAVNRGAHHHSPPPEDDGLKRVAFPGEPESKLQTTEDELAKLTALLADDSSCQILEA